MASNPPKPTQQSEQRHEAPEAWPRRLIVSGGRIWSLETPNKLFHELYPLDELEQPKLHDMMLYEDKRIMRSLKLGAIYSIEAKEHQIRPRTAEFVRMLDNPQLIAGWRIRDDAALVQLKLRKTEQKLSSAVSQLEPVFKGLRRDYMRTDRIGRRAMELALLAALRGERPV